MASDHDPATCRNGDHYGQCGGATPRKTKKLPLCGHTPTPYEGHCLGRDCPRYLGRCDRHDRNEPVLCSLESLGTDQRIPAEAVDGDECLPLLVKEFPDDLVDSVAIAIGQGMVIRRPPRELAFDALAAAAPTLRAQGAAAERERLARAADDLGEQWRHDLTIGLDKSQRAAIAWALHQVATRIRSRESPSGT